MTGTLTIKQVYNFGKVNNQTASLLYVVQCSPDGTGNYPAPLDVHDAVLLQAPGCYGVFMQQDCEVEHIMDWLYMAEVKYARQQNREQIYEKNGPVIDFDTTGGTQHIIVSQDVAASFGLLVSPGAGVTTAQATPPPDPKNVIGWDGKKVRGVDIGYGVFRWSEEWILPDPSGSSIAPGPGVASVACTFGYRASLKDITFTVNDSEFRGFDAGEVLFEGATGRRIKGGGYAVTYKFAVSKNTDDFKVGDITVTHKQGWDYMDVRMRNIVDNVTQVHLQVPLYVYIHSVYDDGDFSTLGIGTGAI